MSQSETDSSPHYRLQRDADLKPYNTMGVTARADRLITVESAEALPELHMRGLAGRRALVLGGGSNILFLERVERPVLLNRIRFVDQLESRSDSVTLRIGAGTDWHELVLMAVSRGWGGIENLALIPGTVGAAPVQNIGAYGVEFSESFHSLEAFDLESGRLRTFSADDCAFGYRDSVFKGEGLDRYMILSVTMKLTAGTHRLRTGYRSLSQWLEEQNITRPGIAEIFRGVVEIRQSKLPDPARVGNAGSFFKNPLISRDSLEELLQRHGEVPWYPDRDGFVKVPAGWLIEKAGWKGVREGDAGVYERQALVLVNHGSATGHELLSLSERVRRSVQELFGVQLEREVRVVGGEYE